MKTKKHIPKEIRNLQKKKINSRRRDHFSCALCGNFNNIESHHIIPLRVVEINETFNYLTLCENCHKLCDLNRYTIPHKIFEKYMNGIYEILNNDELSIKSKFTKLKLIYLKNNFDIKDINKLNRYFNILQDRGFDVSLFIKHNTIYWDIQHEKSFKYFNNNEYMVI